MNGVKTMNEINKELSHVCWLLSETCNSETCNSESASVKVGFPEYLANSIYDYGFPDMRYKWDNYYLGWWVKFRWNGYGDKYNLWFWLGENKSNKSNKSHKSDKSDKNVVKTIINDLYWWDIENGEPRCEEYIWDDYYFGWWKYSEWDMFSDLTEWRWIG